MTTKQYGGLFLLQQALPKEVKYGAGVGDYYDMILRIWENGFTLVGVGS
jgi:hypothetical protein